MEQTKRFSLLWWVTVAVAVLLAVLFAVETPIFAYAEGNEKGKYIKETVMITATSLDDAKAKVKKLNDEGKGTYYLFETPIYKQKDDEKKDVETYLAYTTTNNVNNSVKSIKTMYMKGGWSYEDYNSYLDSLREQATLLASDLYAAIEEYAANLKSGKKNAQYTKKILERLYENDSEKNVSDFFLYIADKGSFENAKEEMITFVMQANKNILESAESALMFSCKDSYQSSGEDDPTFLSGLQSTTMLEGLDGFLNNPAYAVYDTYVQDILCSLPVIQEEIRFYMNSGHMIEDEVEEMALMQEEMIFENMPENPENPIKKYTEEKEAVREELKNELSDEELEAAEQLESLEIYMNSLSLEDKNHYNNGKAFYTALKNCNYPGYEKDGVSEYKNLLGLFMAHEGTPDEIRKEYKNEDFYPIIHKLSKGQRGLLKIGFSKLLYSIVMPVEIMESMYKGILNAVNESAETEEDKIKDSQMVSVYYGVDRSLFKKDNGIALTSEAIVATKSKPLAHVISTGDKVDLACNILAIASGATAAAALMTGLGLAMQLQNLLATTVDVAVAAADIAGSEMAAIIPFLGKQVFTQADIIAPGIYNITAGRAEDVTIQ